jgi:hypothetical protein
MGKPCAPGNTNTGEGVQGKKSRTTCGKSGSEKSKSTGGKCVSENSTGGKSGATRTSNNPFEVSRSEKPQYFVDVMKDKRISTRPLSMDHAFDPSSLEGEAQFQAYMSHFCVS